MDLAFLAGSTPQAEEVALRVLARTSTPWLGTQLLRGGVVNLPLAPVEEADSEPLLSNRMFTLLQAKLSETSTLMDYCNHIRCVVM